MKPLVIATRRSRLALWQSEHVAGCLRGAWPELPIELLPMTTTGDEALDESLARIGGKGLFIKELERALLEGRADLAVHSLKDVPAELPPELTLAAFLPRADVADLWFDCGRGGLRDLPPGSQVGTSSLRRTSQLRAIRPDLEIVALRGNVETRLGRLDQGRVQATILAAAGIERLNIERADARRLAPPEWLPAPGQGVITVECRASDVGLIERLTVLDCPNTRPAVLAERAIVRRLGADCRMPLAALARVERGAILVHARLGDARGRLIDVRSRGPLAQAERLGTAVADQLLAEGGAEILAQLAD